MKYPPVEEIKDLVAMGLSFHTYILGGCTASKPSIIPGSVKSLPIKQGPATPKLASRSTKNTINDPLSASKSQFFSSSDSIPDPLLAPAGLQPTPVVINKPVQWSQINLKPDVSDPAKSDEILSSDPIEEEPDGNSISESNEGYTREGRKEEVLQGIESVITCLEDQLQVKSFNEMMMMRALDGLEKVKDILMREILIEK